MIQRSYHLLKENGQSKDALTTHWKQNEALQLITQKQQMDTQSPKRRTNPSLGTQPLKHSWKRLQLSMPTLHLMHSMHE